MKSLIIFSVLLVGYSQAIIPLKQVSNLTKNLPMNLTQSREIFIYRYVTRLDHFRHQRYANVPFFYSFNSESFQVGGPIFIFVSNTYGLEFALLSTGLIYDISQEVNGLLVTTDTRYFWSHRVTETLSFEDMTYLNVEQMLADVSYLISNVKNRFESPKSKVILIGFGFGATIAAWARQKFPHLVDGVWSSSGIFVSSDFASEPYLHLSNVIDIYAPTECSANVRSAFEQMEYLVLKNDGEALQEALHLCSPFNTQSDLNVALLFETFIEFIWTYFDLLQHFAIGLFCNGMTEPNVDSLELFGNWAFSYFGSNCFDISYANRISIIGDESWDQFEFLRVRQWYHLRCSQLGQHKITALGGTMFGRRVTEAYHYYACREILGQSYDFGKLSDEINRINNEYGGYNLGITHAIFTNGLLDPWFHYGITEYNKTESYVINIPGLFRSSDMFSSFFEPNPQQLVEALARIREIILRWVSTVNGAKSMY